MRYHGLLGRERRVKSLDAISKRGILLLAAGGGLLVVLSYVVAVPVVLLHALAHPRELADVVARDFRRLNRFWSDLLTYED
jgi:hypothetical protein